jgi:hypothetical protein
MSNPSKPLDAQDDCPFFKSRFPPELRNKIYALVFKIEPSEDGSIELNEATRPPSKALTMTCQRLHNETLAMYRASYRLFPAYIFTINMPTRTAPPNIPRAIGNDLILRINAFRVKWNPTEPRKGATVHLTTCFDRLDPPSLKYRARVTHQDGSTRIPWKAIHGYSCVAWTAMARFSRLCPGRPEDPLNEMLGYAIHKAVWNPVWEYQMMKGLQ